MNEIRTPNTEENPTPLNKKDHNFDPSLKAYLYEHSFIEIIFKIN